MRFTKMEGCGNDYIYVNCFEEKVSDPAALSIRMSRKHFGVCSDGLILIAPSDKADFRMIMFNNDGSESGMCGNGIRCVAKYCHDRGLTDKTEFSIETGSGIKHMVLTLDENNLTQSVRVDMGEPVLDGRLIPSLAEGCPILNTPAEVDGTSYSLTLVNMGNPHGVCYVENPQTAPVTTHGPLLECHALFPKKANIEFVHVADRSHINLRVWERGTGETLACGTGTCAAVVASILNGYCDRKVEAALPGGILQVEWNAEDNHVYLTGPAAFVFDGEWLQNAE